MDIIVTKDKLLEFFKLFKLFHLIVRYNVVKSQVLETYLFNFFLEVFFFKHF